MDKTLSIPLRNKQPLVIEVKTGWNRVILRDMDTVNEVMNFFSYRAHILSENMKVIPLHNKQFFLLFLYGP